MGPKEWAKSTTGAYSPQGSGMDNDLPEVPGVEDSGNMKYKYGEPGSHNIVPVPPTGLKGD